MSLFGCPSVGRVCLIILSRPTLSWFYPSPLLFVLSLLKVSCFFSPETKTQEGGGKRLGKNTMPPRVGIKSGLKKQRLS
jgi:hypothetical protein